jgi:integrase/recombinase XerD
VTALAPILQGFFIDKLIKQRRASPHTIVAYRDTMRLLLGFAHHVTGTEPWRLELEQLDAELISAFLHHLEVERGNSVRTRNARLAAIRSLFRHAAWQAPEQTATIQRVLAIGGKRTDTTLIDFLTEQESQALLDATDLSTWIGRRDHTLLLLALRTGLRVSELTHLTCGDIQLGPGAHVRCDGKGRKERCTPLQNTTAAALRDWLTERGTDPANPLFCTRQGPALSPDAVQARIAKYHQLAAEHCPSLTSKNISPHTLRHTTAMALLHAGVDLAVIALWMGHENIRSTQAYLHADLELKERALARTSPPGSPATRYQPADPLLTFLENL